MGAAWDQAGARRASGGRRMRMDMIARLGSGRGVPAAPATSPGHTDPAGLVCRGHNSQSGSGQAPAL